MGLEGFKMKREEASSLQHGPKGQERNFITQALADLERDVPDYIIEFDHSIAKCSERIFNLKVKPLDQKISDLKRQLESLRFMSTTDGSQFKDTSERLKEAKKERKELYGAIYVGIWNRILTRNGTRAEQNAMLLNSGDFFPTEAEAERLKKVSGYDDPFMLDRIIQGAISDMWPKPQPEKPVGEGFLARLFRRGRGISADFAPQPDSPQAEPKKGTPLPDEQAVDNEKKTPKKHWTRRALGAAFNMAAGAGAGVAVRTSVLALTGGSVVAAIGAGAAFSGLLSVGHQHNEAVRARRAEDPQTQGWALHREVFTQNKKSYLTKFLTSSAIFAGGGALGYAYGEQVVDWVSNHIVDPVASFAHTAMASSVESSVPSAPALPSPPVAEVVPTLKPEGGSLTQWFSSHVADPLKNAFHTAVEAGRDALSYVASHSASTPVVAPVHEAVVASVVPVAPAEVVSVVPDIGGKAEALDNVRRLLEGNHLAPSVQDALHRAASDNARISAQGFKDLAHAVANGVGGAPRDATIGYMLAAEALKINPDNAQAALLTAYHEVHGLGAAPDNLAGAYEKATQVVGSGQAGAAQKAQAQKLLDYMTNVLKFHPA